MLHEKLQLVHASPIELMDLLFLIAETRASEIDDFMDESILGTRIEKCVNELTGVEGNGLFQQRPLLGLEVLKAHLKPVQTWGQLHSKITVLALEQYMRHLNANEMDGENNVKLNLKAWMTDKEKTTFLEWKGKEMKVLGKTTSTDTKSGIGSGVNLAQNNIKVQSSSLKYNRNAAIARLKSAKVSETIKQNNLLRNMLSAAGIKKILLKSIVYNYTVDLLKSQIAEICPRIWILASYRYGIMNVGEVKEDDIIYARKIKAIADKWLPPLHAWRQHEETLSFPSLIRKITDELAPTFMIDHVAAAILVDIADSFFATVVRTTLAISESRSYIR